VLRVQHVCDAVRGVYDGAQLAVCPAPADQGAAPVFIFPERLDYCPAGARLKQRDGDDAVRLPRVANQALAELKLLLEIFFHHRLRRRKKRGLSAENSINYNMQNESGG
jgi:hypothetical protein